MFRPPKKTRKRRLISGVTAAITLSPWPVVGGGPPVANADAAAVAAVGALHAGVDGCAAADAAVAASVSAADLPEDERGARSLEVQVACVIFFNALQLGI